MITSVGTTQSRPKADQSLGDEHLERRRYERVQKAIPLVATIVGEREILTLHGRGESLCEGGVSTRLPNQLQPGDLIILELHIPYPTNQIVSTNAIVRHCSSERQGLEFIAMVEEGRRALRQYCKSQPLVKLPRTRGILNRRRRKQCSYCGKVMMYIGSGSYICRTCLHWEYAEGNGTVTRPVRIASSRTCSCPLCREQQSC